ncbi:MAG: helix-turn-helix domain-containing protein [Leptospiraceae bacterium]|nr:helix-turn-helix domain-containing protein [Leptospiraceae bacterium]MCP5498488.1 helix-turn-helix domain-containing protein [Leptospiraceae bacterium]
MKKEQYSELLNHLGLSQRGFAREYNIPHSTVSEIVNGRGKPLPANIIYKIHKDHGISLDWLINGEGDMLGIQSSESLTDDEKALFKEVRENPKLIGFLKGFIETLKKNL